MASAIVNVPNKYGPPCSAKHSRQIVAIRSISACAPAHTLKPAWRALRFIGKAERKLPKPECISPQIERHRARAARLAGNNPALGLSSLRYSAIAKVSHTLIPSWVRHGTKIDGERATTRRGSPDRRPALPAR